MPEKDGAEEKSTKSVVNKKQKQMMGEEGYDIARDMGRVRPSKDKKDATTMPVSKEMRKTQKVNKGPSALELVKKKYGKAVMKVGKKKANEELDLTQVAEAFGGYIIEANGKKKNENERAIDRFIQSDDPFNVPSEKEAARRQVQKDAGEKVKKSVTGTPSAKDYKPAKTEKRKLSPTTPGGKVTIKYATPADERAAAASDALDDMIGDQKQKGKIFLGKPTAEIKQAAKKTINKPLADKVKSDRDKLTSRVKERSALRKGKSAQRQAVAGTSGEKTGSLSKGNLEFPGDRSGAYSQAQADIDFQKLLRRQGATGDFGATMSADARKIAQAKRDQRMRDQETPDPFDVYKKKQDKLQKDMMQYQKTTDQGLRTIASMNPSERAARGIGGGSTGGGSTEGAGGAGSRFSGSGSTKKVTDFTTGKEVERKVPERGGSVVVYNRRKGEDFVRDSKKKGKDSVITPEILPQGNKSGENLKLVNATRMQNIKKTAEITTKKYAKFAQKNPVLGGVTGLAAYDVGKGILGKIKNIVRGLNVEKPTKTGRISAGQ